MKKFEHKNNNNKKIDEYKTPIFQQITYRPTHRQYL